MKTWYRAVCDAHKEAREVMVDSPASSAVYLRGKEQLIYEFLMRHFGCELRLAWRDDHLDALWDEYTVDGRPPAK